MTNDQHTGGAMQEFLQKQPRHINPLQYVQSGPQLLNVVKAAYRKHHLDDDTVGWNELSDLLADVLFNVLGKEGFERWLASVEMNQEVTTCVKP